MRESAAKRDRKQLRKAIGPGLAELVGEHNLSIRAMSAVLNRRLFGRLKWLLFGR
jgi:hypothetical protein